MATASAGKSGASRTRGPGLSLPRFNVLRTLLKTFLPRTGPGLYGGAPRAGRNMLKLGLLATLAGLPNWLIVKYELPDLLWAYYGNGDERWSHAPSAVVANLRERRLPWDPLFITRDDPWKLFVPAYNSMPWCQRTAADDPDSEKAWDAFGDALPGSVFRGLDGGLTQKGSLYHLFSEQDEYDSFVQFYFKSIFNGVKKLCAGAYYDYVYVYWNVPLEERYESLGQKYGRRAARRIWVESAGIGGWKTIGIHEGYSSFLNRSTYW